MVVTSGLIHSASAQAGSVISLVLSHSLMPAVSATTIALARSLGPATGSARSFSTTWRSCRSVTRASQSRLVPLPPTPSAYRASGPRYCERSPRAVSSVSIRLQDAAAIVAQPAPYAIPSKVFDVMCGMPCSVIRIVTSYAGAWAAAAEVARGAAVG